MTGYSRFFCLILYLLPCYLQAQSTDSLSFWREKGYLKAFRDSSIFNYLDSSFQISKGKIFYWGKLQNSSPDSIELPFPSYSPKKKQPVLTKDFSHYVKTALNKAENEGYPFASFYLDSISSYSDELSIVYHWNLGPKIQFDTLVLAGNLKISGAVIRRLVSVLPNTDFQKQRLDGLYSTLLNYPFLSMQSPPKLYFEDGKAKLYLFLDTKNASDADAVLGVLPNTNGSSGVQLSGEARVNLWNLLNCADNLQFYFRGIPGGSQDMKLNIIFPSIAGLPFGLDAHFNAFKRDSSFLELTPKLSVSFISSPGITWNWTNQLRNYFPIRSDASFPEINSWYTGFEWSLKKSKEKNHSGNTLQAKVAASIGQKSGEKIQSITQAQFESKLFYSLRYADYWVTKLDFQAKWLFSESVLPSELYRLGGFNSLKGFNEESISAVKFNMISIEQERIIDANLGAVLLANLANFSDLNNLNHLAYGLAAGLNLRSNSGKLYVLYALGAIDSAPLLLKAAKVHIGYRLSF